MKKIIKITAIILSSFLLLTLLLDVLIPRSIFPIWWIQIRNSSGYLWFEWIQFLNILCLIILAAFYVWKNRHSRIVQLFFLPISSLALLWMTSFCQDTLRRYVDANQSGIPLHPKYTFFTFETTYLPVEGHSAVEVIFLNWDRIIAFLLIALLLVLNYKKKKKLINIKKN